MYREAERGGGRQARSGSRVGRGDEAAQSWREEPEAGNGEGEGRIGSGRRAGGMENRAAATDDRWDEYAEGDDDVAPQPVAQPSTGRGSGRSDPWEQAEHGNQWQDMRTPDASFDGQYPTGTAQSQQQYGRKGGYRDGAQEYDEEEEEEDYFESEYDYEGGERRQRTSSEYDGPQVYRQDSLDDDLARSMAESSFVDEEDAPGSWTAARPPPSGTAAPLPPAGPQRLVARGGGGGGSGRRDPPGQSRRRVKVEMEEQEEGLPLHVLAAMDELEEIRPIISSGPRWKLESYLQALDRLQRVQEVFDRTDCAEGVGQAEEVMGQAMDHLLEEFGDALEKHSKPLPPTLLREISSTRHAGLLVDPLSLSAGGGGGGAASSRAPSVPVTPRLRQQQLAAATASSAGGRGHGASSPSSSGSSSPASSLHSSGPRAKMTQEAHVALQEWLPSSAVPFLRRMAMRLVYGGEGERCVKRYVAIRCAGVGACLKSLELGRAEAFPVSSNLPWPEMESIMKAWVTDLRTVIKVLLVGEQTLCEEIFEGLDPDSEVAFLELVGSCGAADALLCLAERGRAVAQAQCTPERLYALLDMLVAVRELRPAVDSLVSVPGFSAVSRALDQLPQHLADAVLLTFDEIQRILEEPPVPLETEKKKSLFRKSSDQPVPEDIIPSSGGVHPITSWVVNYISGFLDRQSKRSYRFILQYVFAEFTADPIPIMAGAGGLSSTSGGSGGSTNSGFLRSGGSSSNRSSSGPAANQSTGSNSSRGSRGSNNSGSQQQMVRIVAPGKRTLESQTLTLLNALMKSLELRASASSDLPFRALFLMNNAVYVYRHMSDSSGFLVDLPEWSDVSIVEKYMLRFTTAALKEPTSCLEEQGGGGGSWKLGSRAGRHDLHDVKSRLEKFNKAFNELAFKQGSWQIMDEEHRKKARGKLAQQLKEAYSSYLLPYREELGLVRTYQYSPDNIEKMVLDFFFLSKPTQPMLMR